jgi:glutathione S-transferase
MTKELPILYGKYLSPYVRRVAVSLNVLGFTFEHRILSAVTDLEEREAVNPVGRVPALRIASGEVLIDSNAILDHFDELAGPDQALVPRSGERRRTALLRLALATGAIDRSMTANGERRRKVPEQDRIEGLLRQCRQGFQALEEELGQRMFFDGENLRQVDITTAIGFRFVNHIFPETLAPDQLPSIADLSDRCEAMAIFESADYGS